MKKCFYLVFIVLLLGGFPRQVDAANFSVGTATDLINAINIANSNGESDTITLTADIVLTAANNSTDGDNGLPVILPDGGNSLTINGDGFTLSRSGATAFRIMYIASGANVIINNLTIENGLASGGGLATLGAGIYTQGTLTVNQSIFTGNTATGTSGLGAGIFVNAANATITDSTFSGNSAAHGAGIYHYLNSATLIGNTFTGNTASYGGAVADENSITTLINNTFSGNTATFEGGAISRLGGSSIMSNNTITNNNAGTNGGGIHLFSGTITLHNNIIAGNTAPSNTQCYIFSSVMNTDSFNIFGTGGNAGGCPVGASDIVPAGAIGSILSPLANNSGATLTHALVPGSPALDAANQTNCPTTDQRGILRGFDANATPNNPQLGDCDIGAYEFSLDPIYDSNPAVSTTINLGSTLIGTEITAPLQIIEAGGAALIVSLNSITGVNAADFSIIGLSTTVLNGNPPQSIAIICSPSAAGLRTAQATFNTNDPTQPTVSYDLACTGISTVTARASILGMNQIVTEDAITLNLTVQLDVPAGFSDTNDVTVEIVDAASGNAASGADYAVFPATIVTFTGPLTPGTYTQAIAVDVLEDSATEGAEYLTLQINSMTGMAEAAPGDTHTIVINDDDGIFAQASFVQNSAIIDEAAGTLNLDVQLFIPVGFSMTGDVILTISDTLTGNATSGTDYTPFAPINITFVDAPFVIGTTYTQTISLPILDDAIQEGVETFELAITGISGPVELLSPAAFTGIINDDEITTVITNQPIVGDVDFIFKTVDNPLAGVGETITYTIRARNPKSIPLTQVVIYDVFDERLTDVQLISTTHGVGNFNANTLTVSGFTLQPNEEVVIIASARIASLRAGDVIPNAAILESPDASVHVSNLALIGDLPRSNTGNAALLLVIPNQLPSTGETPFWRWGILRAASHDLPLHSGF